MKEKFFAYLGIIMIFYIVLFRSYYYTKTENISMDRDTNSKVNIENLLYEEISAELNLIVQEGSNFDASLYNTAQSHLTREAIVQHLISVKNSMHNVSNVNVILTNGQYYSTNNNRDSSISVWSEEWYLKTTKRNTVCITSRTNNEGVNSCIISFPMVDNNNYIGAIGYEIDVEQIRKIIDNNMTEFKQIYIFDENGNTLYQYANTYNEKKTDTVRNVSRTLIDSNEGSENLDFTIRTIYGIPSAYAKLETYKYVFAVILVIVLILGIFRLVTTKNKDIIIRLSFEMFALLAIESLMVITYMINLYDHYVNENVGAAAEYKKVQLATYEFFSNNFYHTLEENLNGEEFTETIFDIPKVREQVLFDKTMHEDIINFFFVNEKGQYTSYPLSDSVQIEQQNFNEYRELYNNVPLLEYSDVSKGEDEFIYSHLYKIKKDDEILGIVGINMRMTPLRVMLNKNICNGDYSKEYIMLENGSIYFPYTGEIIEYESQKHIKDKIFFKFEDDKRDKMLEEEIGWIKEAPVIDAKRYLFFKDMDDEEIGFIHIDIEKQEVSRGEIILCIIIYISVLTMYIVLLRTFSRANFSKYVDLEKEINDSIETKKVNGPKDLILEQRKQIFAKNEEQNVEETKPKNKTLIRINKVNTRIENIINKIKTKK